MSRIAIVARHEYGRHAGRAGFLIGLLVVPALLLGGATLHVVTSRPAASRPAKEPHPDQLRRELLAGQPPAIVNRAIAGTQCTVRSPDGAREFTGPVRPGTVLPAIAGLLLLVLIFTGSGYLTEAVVEEKANRTLEVLATAMPPERLVAGKILGITAATLTQLLAWTLSAILAAGIAATVEGPGWLASLAPSPGAALLSVALLVPAYVLVAAAFTAAGTALAEARAGQAATFLVMSLLLTATATALPLMEDARSPLATTLSLLPLLSAALLPLRQIFTPIPAWQLVTAVGGQALLAAGAVWLSGRALRLGILRIGQPLAWSELLTGRAARGKARTPAAARAKLQKARTTPRRDAGAPGARRLRSKTVLVARHEAWTTLTKPVFLGLTIGLPLLLAVQMAAMGFGMRERGSRQDSRAAAPAARQLPRDGAGSLGYVDPGGIVRVIPGDVPAGLLRAMPDEDSARRALQTGQIEAYALVPADWLESGRLVVVREDPKPPDGHAAGPLPWVLLVNALGGDEALAARVESPEDPAAAPAPAAPSRRSRDDDGARRLIALLAMLLLYAVVLLTSGLLLRSVSDEKKNRTIEVLLSSASPRQLLAGKVVGLAVAGLVQAALWASVLGATLAVAGRRFTLPPGSVPQASVIGWGVALFLAGYAAYAGLFAGAGALMPDAKEAGPSVFLLSSPALVGFIAAQLAAGAPHSGLAVGLSLFPLTAPFVMMMRLVAGGGVPLWQLLVSLGLMAGAAIVFVRAAARMFRAQLLLSGEPFSFARYVAALRDRG